MHCMDLTVAGSILASHTPQEELEKDGQHGNQRQVPGVVFPQIDCRGKGNHTSSRYWEQQDGELVVIGLFAHTAEPTTILKLQGT